MAAMCVAKTSYCSSRMLVTFSWKAKYSSPTLLFLRVDFMKFTSSLTFFLSTWSTLACTSSYSYYSMCSSAYFSECARLLLMPRFSSTLLFMSGRLGCFFEELERLLPSGFSRFTSSFFFCTPELF